MNQMTDKKFDAFQAMMMSQFARLAEQAGKYIRRLDNEDREAVLARALIAAWEGSDNFSPTKMSLLTYWDLCLRAALQQRPRWSVRFFDRRRMRSTNYILMEATWL